MKKDKTLKIIPLGGLGEFGMNSTIFQYENTIIVVDAGAMFPGEELLGIDTVIPDFDYIEKHAELVKGVILTHGHEDHIGAMPFLLPKIDCPVYGTKFTLGLLKRRFQEHTFARKPRLEMIKPNEKINIPPFEIDFIRAAHSIPDSVLLAISSPEGAILHCSDFKLDQTPIIGEPTDLTKLSQYGERSVLALLSDSTNAEVPGISPSERIVGATLEPVIQNARRRVFFTTFSSHIPRIQQVVDIAVRTGRKICFVGRSMSTTTDVAKRLGYLKIPHGLICEAKKIMALSPRKGIVIISGSQGEPMSALSRVALDDHRDVRLEEGDLAILSSKIIPGNEKAISSMINHIYKKGADVLLETMKNIHASGHPSQEELKIVMNLARPDFFIPIHGEYRQLMAHATLAKSVGISHKRIIVGESGDIIEFKHGQAYKTGRVPIGMIYIDREFEEVEKIIVKDRQHIAEDGILIPVIAINKQTGKIEAEPEIMSRGFIYAREHKDFFADAADVVLRTLHNANPEERKDKWVIKTKIYKELKKHIKKKAQRRPMIHPVIIEI
jgi:ribonuclease J